MLVEIWQVVRSGLMHRAVWNWEWDMIVQRENSKK